MRRRTMLCAVTLCALWQGASAGAVADQGKTGGATMNVHASLSVDARHEKVLVTFKVENRGERRAWLPRTVAAEDGLTGRLFDLRAHPGGAEVPYTGPLVKRGPLTAADFVELAPHSAHTHTIDITPFYDFAPGQHTYVIRYEGAGLADVKQLEATSALETGEVMFSHTAP
jgi:hypothetical protein